MEAVGQLSIISYNKQFLLIPHFLAIYVTLCVPLWGKINLVEVQELFS
ncbi:hypothetical protein NIES2098_18640 [Calothrix sp. NIES-2098]|nr:hypothetical protein NIES2098_18640 [Calothrix sp. NIES-2098]